MFVAHLARLTSDSTLADLPAFDVAVAPATPGDEVCRLFESRPDLPGVLVAYPEGAFDLIARAPFFQIMSRPFSLAIYQKRPIQVLLNALPSFRRFIRRIARAPPTRRPAVTTLLQCQQRLGPFRIPEIHFSFSGSRPRRMNRMNNRARLTLLFAKFAAHQILITPVTSAAVYDASASVNDEMLHTSE
jgi:hypothetical protein